MSVVILLELFYRPTTAWGKIAANAQTLGRLLVFHVLPLALIPTLAWYFGVTEQGWRVGSGPLQYLTPKSAAPIMVLFYLAMVAGVLLIGYMVHWMAATYGAASTVARGVAVISYAATPFFLAGVVGVYPNLWFGLICGFVALAYCVYLLYLGIPAMMQVSYDRGFLFASAVVAVCLVALITLMGASVTLWDLGVAPVYTD